MKRLLSLIAVTAALAFGGNALAQEKKADAPAPAPAAAAPADAKPADAAPAAPAGARSPRWAHAAGVATRPRGVRARNPARTRNGSQTVSTVSDSSPTATANVESPLDSAVVLSGPDSGYKLYARAVAEQPLNADLVTVSACRSAGERAYSGEGLVGFAWAFLRAGARRVIAGLWDVDDRSTARLMDALYDGVNRGLTPAASLRAAKLALIASDGQLARPYYWGPFQLFTVTP